MEIRVNRAFSYGELQQRLQQRLEVMREKRKAREAAAAANGAREWQEEKRQESLAEATRREKEALRREKEALQKSKLQQAQQDSRRGLVTEAKDPGRIATAKRAERGLDNEAEPHLQLSYGRLKVGDEETGRKSKRSRARDSLQQVAQSQDPSETWKAAAERASGVKVKDDPKLLKRTLHKQEKARQKSAAEWDSRVKQARSAGAVKQKRRQDNLQQRVDNKKKTRIAKREKKLMRRPGFEGQVGGAAINAGAAS
eukprot:TRINITY_DN2674_c0_g1_i1.p1 TRINITY_DN2674_c0_g1~~TRINITY_DN2674_c0_g1_i1.p1  ORF type:complete len:255 (-),score=79.57 TRINITY_DN2674_c0_g1_i1:966-1730(-)